MNGLRVVEGSASTPLAPAAAAPEADVDEWGASRFGMRVGRALGAMRWSVRVGGAERLPIRTGALLVTNPRRGALVPPMTSLALGAELRRTVRFAGHGDVAPTSVLLRKIGAVLALPDEVEAALRGGALVVVGASPTTVPGLHDLLQFVPLIARHWNAGNVPVAFVAAARAAGVPVHPVAVLSSPIDRSARIEICPAVRPRLDRRGPLAHIEQADRVRRRLQQRLDEISVGDG